MSKLAKLTKSTRETVVEDALEAESPPADMVPNVNDRAYEAVDGLIQKGTPPVRKYIAIIEEYLECDPESLEDYDAVRLIEEHYQEKEGLTRALKGAAATCVMHNTMDELERLGLQ